MDDVQDTTRESITSVDFEDRVLQVIREYNKGNGFSDIKLTDTPKDANQVVPRKYVTLNGNTASRPTSSVTGQFYLDTQIGKPIWWNGTNFQDSQGNVV